METKMEKIAKWAAYAYGAAIGIPAAIMLLLMIWAIAALVIKQIVIKIIEWELLTWAV